MKKKLFAVSLLSSLFLYNGTGNAGDFPIKRFDLGSTYESLKDYEKSRCTKDGDQINCIYTDSAETVAEKQINGVVLTYGKINEELLLESYFLTFSSSGYSDVKEAIAKKFGKLTCNNSKSTNLAGAVFNNETCTKNGKSGDKLILRRYAGDVETSSLSVSSKKSRERDEEKSEKNKNDI